jgi:hypothetical protein
VRRREREREERRAKMQTDRHHLLTERGRAISGGKQRSGGDRQTDRQKSRRGKQRKSRQRGRERGGIFKRRRKIYIEKARARRKDFVFRPECGRAIREVEREGLL